MRRLLPGVVTILHAVFSFSRPFLTVARRGRDAHPFSTSSFSFSAPLFLRDAKLGFILPGARHVHIRRGERDHAHVAARRRPCTVTGEGEYGFMSSRRFTTNA
jgi:hypothetical protein